MSMLIEINYIVCSLIQILCCQFYFIAKIPGGHLVFGLYDSWNGDRKTTLHRIRIPTGSSIQGKANINSHALQTLYVNLSLYRCNFKNYIHFCSFVVGHPEKFNPKLKSMQFFLQVLSSTVYNLSFLFSLPFFLPNWLFLLWTHHQCRYN